MKELNCKSLSLMHLYFIRPHLEYTSGVWGGCSLAKLEQVQFSAARIVTDLPIFASKDSLYFETGWSTLSSRRI